MWRSLLQLPRFLAHLQHVHSQPRATQGKGQALPMQAHMPSQCCGAAVHSAPYQAVLLQALIWSMLPARPAASMPCQARLTASAEQHRCTQQSLHGSSMSAYLFLHSHGAPGIASDAHHMHAG